MVDLPYGDRYKLLPAKTEGHRKCENGYPRSEATTALSTNHSHAATVPDEDALIHRHGESERSCLSIELFEDLWITCAKSIHKDSDGFLA